MLYRRHLLFKDFNLRLHLLLELDNLIFMTLYFFVFGERQLFDNQVGLLPYLGDLKFKLLYCY